MSLTREDVMKIAHLARLALTDDELTHYGKQLSAVLDYAARLNELDLNGVAPADAGGRQNVTREDAITPSLTREDALFNASATREGQFLIQSVLDD